MKQTMYQLIYGKRVLLLGFGREGRSTLSVLQEVGGYHSITIADQQQVIMPEGVEASLLCGDHYQDSIDDYDVVIKSPGIVLKKPFESYKAVITSQAELFLWVYGRQTIGVTGTKGKSTTVTLLYHTLKTAGVDCVLLGNIGIPPFDRIEEMTPETMVVMELSCHQLEYTRFAPHTAVLLNVYEEHLDHYGTVEKYRASKENIYRWQQSGDYLLCNVQCLPEDGTCPAEIISVSGDDTDADVRIAGNTIHLKDGASYDIPADIRLLGHHNAFDIAVVYALCNRAFISDETFTAALKTYEPLPHRLQPVGEYGGIRFYDDSISTIGETTINALETLKDTDTVLIGGMERGIDYSVLTRYLSTCKVPHIILMEATGKRIYAETMALSPNAPERFLVVEHLEDAVKLAKEITAKGKVCLLSPAAASYGIFKNFEERGERFQQLVKQ